MYKQLIIDTAKKCGVSLPKLAYILATAAWETNHTFEPVKEAYYLGGKKAENYRKKLRYYPYYGRGFVQLTWKENYLKASKYFGKDFVANPDEVMEPETSALILVVGMLEGWFTGKALKDYIDDLDESDKEDFLEFYNARRIINGMDKANDIAVLAEKYEKELREAGYGVKSPQPAPQKEEPPVKGNVPEKQSSSIWSILLGFLLSLFTRKK
jgi:hypothetical protein